MKKAIGYFLLASPILGFALFAWYTNTLDSFALAMVLTTVICLVCWYGIKLLNP